MACWRHPLRRPGPKSRSESHSHGTTALSLSNMKTDIMRTRQGVERNYSLLRLSAFLSATKIVLHVTKFIHNRRLGGTVCGFATRMQDESTLYVHRTWREANLPNRVDVASEPHEHIPFLLVCDGTISLGNFFRVHYFLEAS